MIAKLENFMMQFVARIAGILIQAFTLQDALNRIRGEGRYIFSTRLPLPQSETRNVYLLRRLVAGALLARSACGSVM
jgi:hypothetical protein